MVSSENNQSLYTLIKDKEYVFQKHALIAVLLKYIKCPRSSESVKIIILLEDLWVRNVTVQKEPASSEGRH